MVRTLFLSDCFGQKPIVNYDANWPSKTQILEKDWKNFGAVIYMGFGMNTTLLNRGDIPRVEGTQWRREEGHGPRGHSNLLMRKMSLITFLIFVLWVADGPATRLEEGDEHGGQPRHRCCRRGCWECRARTQRGSNRESHGLPLLFPLTQQDSLTQCPNILQFPCSLSVWLGNPLGTWVTSPRHFTAVTSWYLFKNIPNSLSVVAIAYGRRFGVVVAKRR